MIRAKVKHPGYLALARLKEGISPKRYLDLVRLGEDGEFLATFPEYGEAVGAVRRKYEDLASTLEAAWDRAAGIPDQKQFALAIQGVPCSGVLFNRRARGVGIRQGLAALSLDALAKALNL